jgi:group I intron endonuclease
MNGIYCIKNIVNGKMYIGQASDLYHRKAHHFSDLKNNKHPNLHLQNSWNKYGKDNFKFYILLYCEFFELTRYEQFFVDLFTPEILYNKQLICVDSNLGGYASPETRLKMSQSRKGKPRSDETKRKISEGKKGKSRSKEARDKLSEIRSGKGNPMFGKHHSEETKKKMSECAKKNSESKNGNI